MVNFMKFPEICVLVCQLFYSFLIYGTGFLFINRYLILKGFTTIEYLDYVSGTGVFLFY